MKVPASLLFALVLLSCIGRAQTAPTFTVQPANASTTDGGSFTVDVHVTTSNFSSVTWKVALKGRTIAASGSASSQLNNSITASVLFGPVTVADSGPFQVIATNDYGSTSSAVRNLAVSATAPSITTQPTSQSATVGTNTSFSVAVTGTAPIAFQWQKDGAAIAGATNQTLQLNGLQQSDSGNYTVIVSNTVGSVSSNVATLTVSAVRPTIITQPQNQTVTVGSSVAFAVTASGTSPLSYQWSLNSVPLSDGNNVSGAMTANLTLTAVAQTDAGNYTVTVKNTAGSVTSSGALLTVNPAGPAAWISNLSVRANLALGKDPLIVGVTTNGSKNILVRAVGPTLVNFGLTAVLPDPQTELRSLGSSNITMSNDNWDPALSSVFTSVSAFPLIPGSNDSAWVQTLNGTNTISVPANGTGIVLVEAYDTDPNHPTNRLINISARYDVGIGDNILIEGFSIIGVGSKKILIRGVGPSLTNFGVSDTLSDPQLEVYNGNHELVATNDDWDPSLASVFKSVNAFPLNSGSKDAALVATLPAGSIYSVEVKGAGGGTGQALVEIYELP